MGDFKSEKLSEEQRRKLVAEVKGQLKKEAAFTEVLDKVPLDAKDDQTVLLDGEVVEFREGSRALQLFVGWGAGASKVSVAFRVSTVNGQQIAAFSAKRSYAGGFGIGGASFVSMESLIERVAEDIVTTLSKWKRGEQVGDEDSEAPKR